MDVWSDPTFWRDVALSAATRLAVIAAVMWGVRMLILRRREPATPNVSRRQKPWRTETATPAVEGSRRLQFRVPGHDTDKSAAVRKSAFGPADHRVAIPQAQESGVRQRLADYLKDTENQRTLEAS